jgi:hypothetical protein
MNQPTLKNKKRQKKEEKNNTHLHNHPRRIPIQLKRVLYNQHLIIGAFPRKEGRLRDIHDGS